MVLLALFPAITALVSSYALFADTKTVNDHISFLSEFLPPGTFSIVQDQVTRVLSNDDMKLGSTFIASLLLAIWSANGGMKAIIDALNVVNDEKEKRGFFYTERCLPGVYRRRRVGDTHRDRFCCCRTDFAFHGRIELIN